VCWQDLAGLRSGCECNEDDIDLANTPSTVFGNALPRVEQLLQACGCPGSRQWLSACMRTCKPHARRWASCSASSRYDLIAASSERYRRSLYLVMVSVQLYDIHPGPGEDGLLGGTSESADSRRAHLYPRNRTRQLKATSG
jgi:hypothetical protein